MKYMGSKNRIAKPLLEIILRNRQPGQYYVEPFVGGANLIDKVENPRIGNDINSYLIALLQATQNGWLPPKEINETWYHDIKYFTEKYEKALVGYTGFQLSYGALWFSNYRKDKTKKRNYSKEAYNNIIKQIPGLKGIEFHNKNYWELIIPHNSIVYCDPPYQGTTSYKINFDHEKFWNWVRKIKKQGHQVFISEYNAPEDFKCIWEKPIISQISKKGNKNRVEKLFI